MKATLPDGKTLEFTKGTTAFELAKQIGPKLAEAAIACKIDGALSDLSAPLQKSCSFQVVTWKDPEGKEVFWHSASHVMAKAVKRLFHGTKLTIGPPVEEGFYYDFDSEHAFTPDDFAKIEAEFSKIVAADEKFQRMEMSTKEAKEVFGKLGETYKVEMMEELEAMGEKKISLYSTGKDFTDLCKGPHAPSTGKLKAFKILKNAGAYWHGDIKNKMLQRLYAVAYPEKKMLDERLRLLEEAEKRDHRKLGRELEIFMTHEYSLSGSPFFLNNGTVIYNELQKFMREEYLKRGYQEVITPQLFKKKLWETSGHWDHYRENMFCLEINKEEYSIKAMNCPSHLLIYNATSHSYRDLPLRIADFCSLHRNELAGVVGGLVRVTKLSQDDAHVFVTPDQLEDEIVNLLNFMKYVYTDIFGFEYKVKLSTKPENSMGDPALWEKAEKALASALKRNNIGYTINAGDGAFYGPKIDVDITDALGRPWQCATFQLDFQMPRRFDAEFVNAEGKKEPVIMIHRAIFGSLERFIGILIEHYSGKFPTWLSPVQVMILPLVDEQVEHCRKLDEELRSKGIRSTVDARNEKLEAKIRDAQMKKVPYMLVIGKREAASGTVSVRKRTGEVTNNVKMSEFVPRILKEIESRKNELTV